MPPLPSLTKVAPVFFTRHFLLTIVIAVGLTCTINGIIDYFMNRDKAPFYLINDSTLPTLFIYAAIMSLLVFAGAGEVHKRIKAGKCEPIACYALKDTVIKRFLFFPIGEPNWKCRLPLWIWWCLMVPPLITYVFLLFFCWSAMGFKKLGSQNCECSIAEYVVWTEVWKGFIAAFMTATNYAAAHNDEQKELQDTLVGDDAMATTGQADLYADPATRK
jgi:hypothetical protein